MIQHYEYIKWHLKYENPDSSILLLYEVDVDNDRYATRMIEVFVDGTVKLVIEPGFAYITEAPVPEIGEINKDEDFFAEIISKEEFEYIYNLKKYQW